MKLTVGLLSTSVALSAIACEPVPDPRSFTERLEAEPIAFIGVVKEAKRGTVKFEVEHVLHGTSTGLQEFKTSPPSTCVIAFEPGDRWLYAGDTAEQPSVRLGLASEATAVAMGRLRREDDGQLSLPAQWQACTADAQCVVLTYGCARTAVNAAREAAARAKIGKTTGVGCKGAVANVEPLPNPLCVASRCGTWVIDRRR